MGKLGKQISTHMIVEILTALRKLGEELSPEEQEYLKQNSSSSLRQFQQVTSDLGGCILFFNFNVCTDMICESSQILKPISQLMWYSEHVLVTYTKISWHDGMQFLKEMSQVLPR